MIYVQWAQKRLWGWILFASLFNIMVGLRFKAREALPRLL